MESKKGVKNTFIVYFDDDDEKKEVWVHLDYIKDGFVTFSTQSADNQHKNKISIPISRVLKIKSKEGDDYESTTKLL